VKFSGIDYIDQAEELRNGRLFITEEDRPELDEDEFYYDELVGLRVFDSDSDEEIGTVTSIFEGAGTETLEIRLSDRKILFPVVKEYINNVDLNAGTMTITIPPGLMDIYQ
jgi:16S rRNA processing protein RimM